VRGLPVELLERVAARIDEVPLEGFFPHRKQREFLGARTRVKLFAGGNRSGKTTCGLVDCLVQALPEHLVPEHLRFAKKWRPPFFCRILTPDLVDTQEHVLFPMLRRWCPPAALAGGSWRTAYNDRKRTVEFANGSRFHFMSYEQSIGKMGGASLHRVWYDEEPPEEIRSENRTRLWDKGGDEIFTMTPLNGMTWIYDEIYLKKDDPDVTVVEVDVEENKMNLDWREVEKSLSEMSPEERAARKSGVFVSLSGLVFGRDWSRELVVDERPVPPGVQVTVGIDPGIRYGCGVVWTFVDHLDRLVVFDEMEVADWTIGEIAAEIHKRNARWGVEPGLYIIDPAAAQRSRQTGRPDLVEFAQHGVPAVPGDNRVHPGIALLRDRMRSRRLLVYRGCEQLVKQIERYQWAKSRRQDRDDAKVQPHKRDDHLIDALRYVAMATPSAAPEPGLEDVPPPLRADRVFHKVAQDTEYGPGFAL